MEIPRLGQLEVAILECVWSLGDVSAKDAHSQVGADRGISVNTVQSTLERLFRKGLLARNKQGHAYRYVPALSREELLANLINELLGRFGNDSSTSVAAILSAAEQLDENTLNLLEAEIKNRREREL